MPIRSTSMVEAVAAQNPTELDFEVIYNTHYRRVLNLCRYLLNSPDKAEDASHEVFIRAHAKLDTYNPEFPMSTWLAEDCQQLLYRPAAPEDRGAPYFRHVPPARATSRHPRSASPLSEVLAAERGQDVRRALRSLTEKYRVPLVLAYYNELSYEEISEILGVERTQVAVLIFRGKEHLRQRLGKGLGKERLR